MRYEGVLAQMASWDLVWATVILALASHPVYTLRHMRARR